MFLQQEDPAASLKVVSTRPSTGGSRRPSARDNHRAMFSMGQPGRNDGMKVPTTVRPCVGRKRELLKESDMKLCGLCDAIAAKRKTIKEGVAAS